MQRIKQTMENARVERERRLREWTRAAPTADIIPVVPAASTVNSSGHSPAITLSDDTAMLFARTQVASLDKSKLRGNRLLLPGVIGEAAYAFKMLRTQVLQRLQQHGWNTLAVVSPAPGDGKTFTAMSLHCW
jgi:protein-tyrosine kinase